LRVGFFLAVVVTGLKLLDLEGLGVDRPQLVPSRLALSRLFPRGIADEGKERRLLSARSPERTLLFLPPAFVNPFRIGERAREVPPALEIEWVLFIREHLVEGDLVQSLEDQQFSGRVLDVVGSSRE